MANKAVVDTLMNNHKISRTMANNLVNTGFDITDYRKQRKSNLNKTRKTTTTVRKHRTSKNK